MSVAQQSSTRLFYQALADSSFALSFFCVPRANASSAQRGRKRYSLILSRTVCRSFSLSRRRSYQLRLFLLLSPGARAVPIGLYTSPSTTVRAAAAATATRQTKDTRAYREPCKRGRKEGRKARGKRERTRGRERERDHPVAI